MRACAERDARALIQLRDLSLFQSNGSKRWA